MSAKTKFVFLEDAVGGSGKEFEAGKAYELREDAADHYLRRGMVMTEADYKASQSDGKGKADGEQENADAGNDDSGKSAAGRSGAGKNTRSPAA